MIVKRGEPVESVQGWTLFAELDRNSLVALWETVFPLYLYSRKELEARAGAPGVSARFTSEVEALFLRLEKGQYSCKAGRDCFEETWCRSCKDVKQGARKVVKFDVLEEM